MNIAINSPINPLIKKDFKMKKITLVVLLLSLVSCSQITHKSKPQDFMMGATLWVQNAAEYRALSYQSFNLAKLHLNADLKHTTRDKKRAVVVDIDETILNNSPLLAKLILEGKGYSSENWEKWINFASAKALPGGVEFLNWANSQGVEVFYITNRKVKFFDSTYKNLKEVGYPIKKENLLMRTTKRSKDSRRAHVSKKYHIVLLMGDQLGDFSEIFDRKSLTTMAILVDSKKNSFGKKFIVLPNPLYGAWIWGLYNNNRSILPAERQKAWINHLYSESSN